MTYLFLIIGSLVLFLGFLMLTIVETRMGTRVLVTPRRALDIKIGHAMFILDNVNWGAFFAHFTQSIFARIVHDVAHISLLVVRFAERQLTRVVRYLRDSRPNLLAPRPSRSSPVTQTLDYVKKSLRLPRRKK
jgi:hypothetical protein